MARENRDINYVTPGKSAIMTRMQFSNDILCQAIGLGLPSISLRSGLIKTSAPKKTRKCIIITKKELFLLL